MVKTYSNTEPRQMFLDTLSEFYDKMENRTFWEKSLGLRQISVDALVQDYLRTDHEDKLESDRVSWLSALDEYCMRESCIVTKGW